MSVESLKQNASRIAYELRKNFPEDERPIRHFVCVNEVVVISTKILYIFYYGVAIDYKKELLSNVKIRNKDFKLNKCSIMLETKDFSLRFSTSEEYESFLKYYEKYK